MKYNLRGTRQERLDVIEQYTGMLRVKMFGWAVPRARNVTILFSVLIAAVNDNYGLIFIFLYELVTRHVLVLDRIDLYHSMLQSDSA